MIIYTQRSTYEVLEREDGKAEIMPRGRGRLSLQELEGMVFIPSGVIDDLSGIKLGEPILYTNNSGELVRTSPVVEIP